MRIDAPLITGSLSYNGTSLQDLSTYATTSSVNNLIQKTGSYALTGSNYFSGSQVISGSITATGNITAQTLIIQTITSSVLFSTGSNIIGSSLSNVQQLTGSVGITGSLAINGTATVVGSGTANYVPKFTASGTIGDSNLINDASGNLGLGATPSAWSVGKAIEINNIGNGLWNASAADTRLMTNVYYDGTMKYGSNGVASMMETGGGFIWRIAPSGTAGNAITFTQAMTLGTNSGLSIGTTTAAAANGLLVAGAATFSNSITAGDIFSTDGTRTNFFGVGTSTNIGYLGTTTNHALAFLTNNTEKMRITSGGDVLVGMTSNGGASVTSVRAGLISGQRTVSSDEVLAGWNQATTGDNKFVCFYTEANGTLRGSIDYNRGAGLVRYNTTSDANLKNIIGDADTQKSIDILNSTKIREYSWKDDKTNKSQIGIIAQELYETFKGAVSKGSSNELYGSINYKNWGVDKTAFTFHLIAGWQKHEQIIQELSAKVTLLENK